ncbi:MAG: shikimate dehydrogenase [Actinomycetota bacterium]
MRGRNAGGFAGIIGWPLEHTLSPAMHNAAFKRIGTDWVYLPFAIPPEELSTAVAGLRVLGARGLNVTMPHKERIVEMLDDLSPEAKVIGAVNTIENAGGRLIGHNTDASGFSEFLMLDAGWEGSDKRALVLGAGGAARAVVRALADMGLEHITIAARDPGRAAILELTGSVTTTPWEAAGAVASDVDLIVNSTPVGMKGEDVLPDARFHPGQVVVDLIYSPPSTRLVDRARSQQAEAWSGLGMLVHQAAGALRIWTGKEPPLGIMSAAAVHALGSGR